MIVFSPSAAVAGMAISSSSWELAAFAARFEDLPSSRSQEIHLTPGELIADFFNDGVDLSAWAARDLRWAGGH